MNTVNKTSLSEKQKKKYVEEFNNLIKLNPDSIQKNWSEDGITWENDVPHFVNDVHLKLREKSWGRFMELNRRLDSRNI